jgi:sulfoxide reductase catalytic subunit YedY
MFTPLFSLIRVAFAEAKKIILPRGTRRETLIQKNPKLLDARNLEVTPLKDFETMGITDHEVTLDQWRLYVEGEVKTPLKLTYSEMKTLPSIKRKVLLICPGFFAIHGLWKGISMEKLLQRAGIGKGATHVTFAGPEGHYEKVERFPINDIRSGKVFLAYEINGESLPRKHGFPLRLIAEDYYGSYWVKYVYKATVNNIRRNGSRFKEG